MYKKTLSSYTYVIRPFVLINKLVMSYGGDLSLFKTQKKSLILTN